MFEEVRQAAEAAGYRALDRGDGLCVVVGMYDDPDDYKAEPYAVMLEWLHVITE